MQESQFAPDAQAMEPLLVMFKDEPNETVRYMVGLALSALHDTGIAVPLFDYVSNATKSARTKLAIECMIEFGVLVGMYDDYIHVFIPVTVDSPGHMEIRFLIAPLARPASRILPSWSHPTVDFYDRHYDGMEFRIRRSKGAERKG